jgi:exoribonuclease-2
VVTLGIHIAAPGLALLPGSAHDQVARNRLSTVYMPGWKLTMLPDELVQAYTLTEGRDCPAVSLYVALDEASLEVRSRETRLERVPIAANLRHDRLDAVITEASLSGEAPADYAFAPELAFCFRLARQLKAQRELVRGKPENFNRPDYNFRLQGRPADQPAAEAQAHGPAQPAPLAPLGSEPDGSEQVLITTRQRGAPLDLIVAEAMILANSSWGAWLAELGVPAIYRSQSSLAPGIKVRMGTRALPHAGMGVSSYAWSTSPLRRYVDLVNQWQIIACAQFGRTAALAAPFKPKDATLLAIISDFDATYSAYNAYQGAIERFWTLRWLEQNGVTELEAAVMKDGLARAATLPLVFRVPGTESMARGTAVKVRIGGCDLLTLELFVTLLARLEAAPAAAAATVEADDADEGDDAQAEAGAAGPLSLAIEVDDSAAYAAADTTEAASAARAG